MVNESHVKAIKLRIPLSSVVKEVIALKGRGERFLGLCPFHKEKTPSFHVRDREGRFKCFGCGASGDIFEFVMKLRGVGFLEALSELSEKAGIANKEERQKTVTSSKDDLLQAQAIAQEFFLGELLNPGAKAARSYLQERGLSATMIKEAGIGFAGTTEAFISALKKRGVSAKAALGAGLIKQGNYGFAMPFANRITLPIRNSLGKIVAFGARSVLSQGNQEPKYVNTHSYAHYEKRTTFYGLFESKNAIVKGKPPILVEGYFDAMAMWALGFPALALCGTALSSEHVAILKKLTNQVIICFDGDAAGFAALKKALAELFKRDLHPSLIELSKKDPGAYLAEGELAALHALSNKQKDAFCFVIEKAKISDHGNMMERIAHIDALVPIFRSIRRPLVRRQYVSFLAKTLHEDPSILWGEIENNRKKKGTFEAEAVAKKTFSDRQRLLFEILFADPELFGKFPSVFLTNENTVNEVFKAVASFLVKEKSADGFQNLKNSVVEIAEEFWPTIEDILYTGVTFSKEEAHHMLTALLAKGEEQKRDKALKIKRVELEELEKLGDFEKVLRNLKERSMLLKAKKINRPNNPGQERILQEPKYCLSEGVDVEKNAGARDLNSRLHEKDKCEQMSNFKRLDEESFFNREDDWL